MSELTNMGGISSITNNKKYLKKDLDIWIFLLIFKYKIKVMEKEFIPYEIALALKELGFDEPCAASYGSYVHKTSELFLNINNPVNIETLVIEKTGFNRPSFYVKAPLYQQAFRWFREKHGINSTIDNDLYEDDNHIVYSYNLSRISTADDLIELDEDDFVDTYEQAELECLKKLIEIVKNK